MTPNRKNESHHYVPQFYLRHWCAPDGKLWVHGLDGKPGFRATPKNFAAENGLYDTSDVPHLATQDQEGDLSDIESLYSPRWPDIFQETMDLRTKMNISRFLALLYLRHPNQKDTVRTVHAGLRKMVGMVGGKDEFEVIAPDGQRLTVRSRDVLEFASDTPSNTKGAFLTLIRSLVEDLASVLCSRKWGVIFEASNEHVFVTSDSPLVLSRGTCSRSKFGFGSPGTEITFPISPSKFLRISDTFECDGLHYPLLNLGDLNDATVLAAERFVFSSRELKDKGQGA